MTRTTASIRAAWLAVPLALVGLLLPAQGADQKPDKKKSQAALLRGKKADEGGQRVDALAAYAEALQADPTNADAYRLRGKDYQAEGEAAKALADFDKAIELQPGGGVPNSCFRYCRRFSCRPCSTR